MKLKNIISKILAAFAIIIFMYNLYNFICIKMLHKGITSFFGYSILEVASGSMEPTIKIGDLIVIKLNDTHYKKNDIITFYDENDSLVTHRIVSIHNNDVVTKGDNNNTKDDKIDKKDIVGKYKFKITGAGILLRNLRKPFIIIMIFGIGIGICIITSIEMPKKINQEEYEQFQEYKKNRILSNLNIGRRNKNNNLNSKKRRKRKKREKRKRKRR